MIELFGSKSILRFEKLKNEYSAFRKRKTKKEMKILQIEMRFSVLDIQLKLFLEE